MMEEQEFGINQEVTESERKSKYTYPKLCLDRVILGLQVRGCGALTST